MIDDSSSRMGVAHFMDCYLGLTETFIHEYLTAFRRARPVVIARSVENRKHFPLPPGADAQAASQVFLRRGKLAAVLQRPPESVVQQCDEFRFDGFRVSRKLLHSVKVMIAGRLVVTLFGHAPPEAGEGDVGMRPGLVNPFAEVISDRMADEENQKWEEPFSGASGPDPKNDGHQGQT